MGNHTLHTPETAGWRALLTRAANDVDLALEQPVEDYLTCLLVRQIGRPTTRHAGLERGFALNFMADGSDQGFDDIAEQCLLFAGLFPEQAAEQMMPVSYFVRLGQDAYRRHADASGDNLYALVGARFVKLMDVLQSMRDLDTECFCLDALSAYAQWQETGSAHAYRVLRALTGSVPACGSDSATPN